MPKAMPKNIKAREILVTDLAQQLKKQRDFLKWMARRYKDSNPEQSAAFQTGADLLEEIRVEIQDGFYDLPGSKNRFFSAAEIEQLFDEVS